MKIICPGCKTEYQVDESAVGESATCLCGQTFTIVLPDEYRNRFVFDCPECSAVLQSNLRRCGDFGFCPECQKQIQIPDSPDKTYFDTRIDFTPKKDEFCFHAADYDIAWKILRVTNLTSKQITEQWSPLERQQYFFSSRVTDPIVLARLRDYVISVLRGRMTDQQAVGLLRDYFAGPGAASLAKFGFAPKADARTTDELASIPRLELIIETNVRMAQEYGHYQGWAESAAYYRYGIWRCGYSKKHRPDHLARDGRVYPFEHPIWTQSPPAGEVNCHCYREVASEYDIQELGLTPEPLDSPFKPSSLSFDPSLEF